MESSEVPDYTETRPPAYTPAKSSGKPPSYDEIQGQLHTMKAQSSGNVDYGRRVVNHFFCGTVCTFIWIVILFIIPIAMIVVGAKGLDKCPRERYVPIYLIVAGAFGLLKALANLGEWCFHRKKETTEDDRKPANPFDGCINIFLFGWFIAGSYWVYHIHGDYDGTLNVLRPNHFCQEGTYLFAFWLITIKWIFMALSLLFCFGFCCCMICCGLCGKKPDEESN